MPRSVYLMALGVFVMVTSELIVGGLMPQISEDLSVSIPRVGYLITAFALAMAIGGPLATAALLRLRPKNALLVLFAVFFVGNALAAASTSYWLMVVARIITGTASGAFFGIALSIVAQITAPHLRGRATGVALQGLMVGTLLGLPMSTLIGGQWGWRAAFVAVGVLTIAIAIATMVSLPRLASSEEAESLSLRSEVAVFRNLRLWFVMSTSTLIIGATFAAFSYFAPILTEVTGFSRQSVPVLLLAYGGATVVGTMFVSRFAQSHTFAVIVGGLALNTAFLAVFANFADTKIPALIAMAGIGLVGISLNPAMITRVQRAGNARALVNTVHSSFITLGVVVGSWLGGLGIGVYGLTAPLWVGVGLALLALTALLPDLLSLRSAVSPRFGQLSPEDCPGKQ